MKPLFTLLRFAIELYLRRLSVYIRKLGSALFRLHTSAASLPADTPTFPQIKPVEAHVGHASHSTPPVDGDTVLIIDARPPRPQHDSGSLRMSEIVSLLTSEGHRVAFVADFGGSRPQAWDGQTNIEFIDGRWGGALVRWLAMNSPRVSAVILCRYHIAWAYLWPLKRLLRDIPFIFDTVDLHGLREWRQAMLYRHKALHRHALETLDREKQISVAANMTWVVSSAESDWWQQICSAPVSQVSNIIAPTQVASTSHAQKKSVIFLGNFNHPPNVDAVEHFLKSVWPAIRQAYPNLIFRILGASPPDHWLSKNAQGVEIVGHVPDLSHEFSTALCSVAPLRFGAGVKGKINSSLNLGVPVVGSKIAFEGMNIEHGKHALLAETAQDYLQAIHELLDEQAWQCMSRHGISLTQQHFSRASALATIRKSIPSRVATKTTRSEP